MKRRTFLSLSLSIPAGMSYCASRVQAESTSSVLVEPEKRIPVAGQYDVIVCGGGPAGVGAALAAARNGAKTLLLETNGCLGGIWTAGILPWILDHHQPGILDEFKEKLKEMDGLCPIATHAFSFDPEKIKLLLENLCVDAGVDFLLHTRVVGAVKSSDRELSHVITESKSGRQAWQGARFVDCTGDGDLAFYAACGFDVGNEDGVMQPGSLHALVDGIRFEELKEFIRSREDVNSSSKGRLLKLLRSLNVEPTYKSPSIFPIRDDLFWVMLNHAYGIRFDDAASITRHTVEARKELHTIINALRSAGGAWSNIRLIGTAEQIGIREARRIHGLYTVSTDDLINGATHEDVVCRVRFGFDVHALGIDLPHGHTRPKRKASAYDVPMRSLIAKDVDNLLMAGRCISGDFFAHSSYRVTGPATVLGEAAGEVAARSVSEKQLPKNVSYKSKYYD